MSASKRFSRRDFLKLSGSAALGLMLPRFSSPPLEAPTPFPSLGRVVYNKVSVFDTPDETGYKLRTLKLNEVIDIDKQVQGPDETAYNRTWYRLADGGYVYSGGIQPVKRFFNDPVTNIPKGGLLAELTVPFTDARWRATEASPRGYRLYYGTTYWVQAFVTDQTRNMWYRVYDDLFKLTFHIRAEQMRIIPPEELTPISPEVPDELKRIVISLPEQLMAAYEGTQLVFLAKISSGVGKNERSWASTPRGAFTTFFKRPAGHMSGGDGVSSYYDLPGVPWTSYLDTNGISIHGTYWHNDYGKPHSHGCVNLPIEQAKWIYRWSTPQVPDGKRMIYKPGIGTQVSIIDRPLAEYPISLRHMLLG